MDDLRRKLKRTICKQCHKQKTKLSRRGLCVDCATKSNQDSISQLRVKRGPIYEKWKTNLMNSVTG